MLIMNVDGRNAYIPSAVHFLWDTSPNLKGRAAILSTSVTAGAVVGALIAALLAGVMTRLALAPHGVGPLFTVYVTASVIKNPVW